MLTVLLTRELYNVSVMKLQIQKVRVLVEHYQW